MMLIGMTSALADGTNNLTLDGSISVSGLQTTDTVDFYRILKFDADAKSTGGWINDTGFNLTDAEIQSILGITTDANGIQQGSVQTTHGITEDVAAKLGKLAVAATAKYANVAVSSGTAKVEPVDDGLYIAIIHPGTAGMIYNPVFVGADYKTNKSNTWAVDISDSYNPASMAKKATVEITKTAKDRATVDAVSDNYDHESETVSIGDTVDYTVTTSIPEFNSDYVEAAFEVEDTLSTGLQLLNSAETAAATATDNGLTIQVQQTTNNPSAGDKEWVTLTKDTDFTYTDAEGASQTAKAITITASDIGYKVVFHTQYLLKLSENTPLKITYKAKVTSSADYSVNEEDNTVIVRFSNDQKEKTSRTKLIDKTNHYTFDIDANLVGPHTGYDKTTEVVKVGLDKNGNEITETTTTLHPGQTKVGALQGAKFLLYTAYTDENTNTPYTNSVLTAGKYIVSDATGRLTIEGETTPGIRGLDAGTYYLVEKSAPAGYIKAQDPVKIEIIPTYEDKEESITDGSDTLKVTVKELKSYIVKINEVQTASYTITNDEDGDITTASEGDTVTGKDDAGYIQHTDAANAASRNGKITNTQGVELPSTGGIGTTIFYVAGSIMVLAAAILLITKRRMGAND